MFSGWPSEECTNLDVREAHPPNDPYCWWRRASNSSSITAVSATTASATTTAAAVVARFWHRQQAGDSDIGWNHGMVTAMNDMDQYIGPVEKHGQCPTVLEFPTPKVGVTKSNFSVPLFS